MKTCNTDIDVIVYQDKRYTLGQKDNHPFLAVDGRIYQLSSHPYEPCTFIKDGDKLISAIHNAFNLPDALKTFAKGNTVTLISGKAYDAKAFCTLVEFAAERLYDTDISYVEGALAVEKLKEMKALSPETAVDVRTLGVRTISDRFSHSKKLAERVLYTEDGKAYVRIKK